MIIYQLANRCPLSSSE